LHRLSFMAATNGLISSCSQHVDAMVHIHRWWPHSAHPSICPCVLVICHMCIFRFHKACSNNFCTFLSVHSFLIVMACQRESPISWASWRTAVFTVWHLGTSLTISLLPLTSLRGFVCVPYTDISLLYLAVDSIHTAVGRFRLPVQRSGIRCRTNWEIQRVVLTVLNSFSRQSFSVSTNVTSALEVF